MSLCLIDIDECDLEIDLCEHKCFNSKGSYYCQCNHGYNLEENSYNCTGIFVQVDRKQKR